MAPSRMSSLEDPEAQDGPFSPFWNGAPMLGCVLDENEPPVARPGGGCEVFPDQVADPEGGPRDRRRTLWSEVGGGAGDRQLGALADAPAVHQGQDVSETAAGLPHNGGRSLLIRRSRTQSPRQAGRSAPLISADHPAWPKNRQCTNIQSGSVDGRRSSGQGPGGRGCRRHQVCLGACRV